MKRFTLTTQHLALLQRANVGWDSCETGAPCIDPKRPYGNSYVAGDVAKILGAKLSEDDMTPVEYESECERMLALHAETKLALEIVLQRQSFEPGTYERESMYGSAWRRVG